VRSGLPASRYFARITHFFSMGYIGLKIRYRRFTHEALATDQYIPVRPEQIES